MQLYVCENATERHKLESLQLVAVKSARAIDLKKY
jgi:hypothetical protein